MNYYNEHDPKAAEWLRQLIERGLIPDGWVDERSIVDVQPEDLDGYTQCHFFAGIGGWSCALQLAGWPEDEPVWTGSCPCQPFSVAGKGKGTKDERHLWPEFFRLIEACRPLVIFGEQVASKAGRLWLSGAGLDMQKMRDRETILGVLREFQGAQAQDLQGLREVGGAGAQAQEPKHRQGLCRMEREEARLCFGQHGQAPSQDQRIGVQSGQGKYPESDRPRAMRDDRNSAQPGRWKDLGQSVVGQDRQQQGLHDGECTSSVVLPECDGERLGGEQNPRSFGCNPNPTGCEIGELAEVLDQHSETAVNHGQFPGVFIDLERVGYACGAADLCAAGVNSPHIRQRLYWVAQSDGGDACEERQQRGGEHRQQSQDRGVGRMGDSQQQRLQGHSGDGDNGDEPGRDEPGRDDTQAVGSTAATSRPWNSFELLPCTDGKARRIEPGTFPLVDGIPRGVVPSCDISAPYALATAEGRTNRLRGYGNAIVPQIAAEFVMAAVETMNFQGAEYAQEFDEARLSGQKARIFEVVSDGRPRTLREIEAITNDPQTSISRQLRYLAQDSGRPLQKRIRGDREAGLWEYWLAPNNSPDIPIPHQHQHQPQKEKQMTETPLPHPTDSNGRPPQNEVTPPDHSERGHHKRSMSKLPYFEACAGFESGGGTNEAALEGTRLHEILDEVVEVIKKHGIGQITAEDALSHVLDQPESVADENDELLLRQCCAVLDEWISAGTVVALHNEIKVHIRNDENAELTNGHLDLLIEYNTGVGVLIDWKFGWVPVQDASINLQGHGYALGCFQQFSHLQKIAVLFFQPKINRRTEHVLDRTMDQATVYSKIEGVLTAAADENSPLAPNPYCDYCVHNGDCPALVGEAVRAVRQYTRLPLPESLDIEKLDTPEKLIKAHYVLERLKTVVESSKIKDHLLELAKASGGELEAEIVPGQVARISVQSRSAKRSVSDPLLIANVISDVLPIEQAQQVVLAACNPAVGELESGFAETLTERRKAEIKRISAEYGERVLATEDKQEKKRLKAECKAKCAELKITKAAAKKLLESALVTEGLMTKPNSRIEFVKLTVEKQPTLKVESSEVPPTETLPAPAETPSE